MTTKKDDADLDVVAVGRAIYAKLQSRVEATDKGSFVVIDAVSGDYEVDPSPVAAKRRLKARQSGARLYERRHRPAVVVQSGEHQAGWRHR